MRKQKSLTDHARIKKEIMDYLAWKHWFAFGIQQNWKSKHGITDVMAIKNGITIYIEVKAGKDKLRTAQVRFRDDIISHDGIHFVPRSLDGFISEMEKSKLV